MIHPFTASPMQNEHGEDRLEIRDWSWPYGTAAQAGDQTADRFPK